MLNDEKAFCREEKKKSSKPKPSSLPLPPPTRGKSLFLSRSPTKSVAVPSRSPGAELAQARTAAPRRHELLLDLELLSIIALFAGEPRQFRAATQHCLGAGLEGFFLMGENNKRSRARGLLAAEFPGSTGELRVLWDPQRFPCPSQPHAGKPQGHPPTPLDQT